MNKVILMGRLCSTPEVRVSQSGTSIAYYRLAVDRRYKKEGEQAADFIKCIAFGKTAEFVEKFLDKGEKIAVIGRIQTGKHIDKEGTTHYTTDVLVEEHYFCEGRKQSEMSTTEENSVTDFDGFQAFNDDDCPF